MPEGAEFVVSPEEFHFERESLPERKIEFSNKNVEHVLQSLRDRTHTDGTPSIGMAEGSKLVQAAVEDNQKREPRDEAMIDNLRGIDGALLEIEVGNREELNYKNIKSLRSYFREQRDYWDTIAKNQLSETGSIDQTFTENRDIYAAVLRDINRHLPTPESIYPSAQPYKLPDIGSLVNTFPKIRRPGLENAQELFTQFAKDIAAKRKAAETDNVPLKTQIRAISDADNYYDLHKAELDDNTPLSVTVTPSSEGQDAEPSIEVRVYDHDRTLPEMKDGSRYFIFDREEDGQYAYGLVEFQHLEKQVENALAGIENLQKKPPVITKSQVFGIGQLLKRLGEEFGEGRDRRQEGKLIKLNKVINEKIDRAQRIKDDPAPALAA